MNKIEEFLTLIRRADFQEIESARDQVTFSDLGALAAAYPSLENWEQKAALINLIQDHLDPRFRAVMLDFLRAPNNWNDDTISLTKAIALCHLDENFDDFMVYYNDRRLLQERVHDYVRDAPRAKEPLPPAQPQATTPKSPAQKIKELLLIIWVTALIVGLSLLALSSMGNATLDTYRERGVTVQGRIADMWQDENENCVRVSYFDKDILEGGELHITETCEFISGKIWRTLSVDDRVDIVFLPEDPDNNTILAVALEKENLAPVYRYPLGWVVLGLGLVAWVGHFAVGRSQK